MDIIKEIKEKFPCQDKCSFRRDRSKQVISEIHNFIWSTISCTTCNKTFETKTQSDNVLQIEQTGI